MINNNKFNKMFSVSLLILLATAAGAFDTGYEVADTFIPASDPRVWYTGRFLINEDGSRSFDWEGAQMHLNVFGATYVKASINATGGILGRFIVEVDGWEVTSFYASDDYKTSEIMIAEGLSASVAHHVRLI
jgi:hypothetical protein